MKKNVSQLQPESHILFVTHRPPIVMARGEGMWLWDTNNNAYLDFIGGWAVTILGHSPKVITDVLSKQSAQLLNASPQFLNQPMVEFAELLCEKSGFDRVFFGSTGAEANESAIKLARKFGQIYKNGAFEIITTTGSFHGRTLATMSATGKAAFKPMFEPKVPGFRHVPFNDLNAIKAMICSNTCAIMLELIQGEGGVHRADVSYVNELRALCDQHNILLIFDEIQTGIGRTGKLFAFEHYNIRPDIMTLGKGIGAGYPLSAMLTTENLNIFEPGEQGGTYTGQPLAMAVGKAVLNTLDTQQLVKNSDQMGSYILDCLNHLQSEGYPISNVRGTGLLIAFDTDKDAFEIVQKGYKNGIIINAPSQNTIRLVPPLIVKKDHVLKLMDILKPLLM